MPVLLTALSYKVTFLIWLEEEKSSVIMLPLCNTSLSHHLTIHPSEHLWYMSPEEESLFSFS